MTEIGYLHRKAEDAARIPELLIHASNITDGAVRLYGHMWWRYQTCGHKNREPAGSMAKALGVSEKTIRNRIMELELNDWVVVVEIGFDKETGKYQTPFYHVFEVQEECRQFRAMYQPKEGERIAPKPEPKKARERKSREGIGGNPNLRNSSSGGDTSGTQVPWASRDLRNSSSDKKESYIDTDSVEYESTEKDVSANADRRAPSNVVPFTQPQTRHEQKAIHKATEKALHLKGSAYGLIEKYANFLAGRTPERAPAAKGMKARSNGKWYEYQVTPGMDAAEIYAFGNFMASYYPAIEPLRKAETINDYAARFRNHPDHDALVKRARVLMALKQEQEATLPVAAGAENQPPPVMATPEQIEQAKAAFEDLMRKKRG